MAADGEPQEDAGDGSETNESSGSTSPRPPPRPSSVAAPASAQPSPPPPAVSSPPSSSAPAPAGVAPLSLAPHLFYQQRLLSLQLSPAASQPRPLHVANSEPSPPPTSDRTLRDDCWSENATLTLIQAWGDRYLELNRGNLKQKHWRDVADCVNSRPLTSSKPLKTDVQCKNRLDTLKKKYKIEKGKLVTGGAPSKWAFFDRLDDLIGSSKKANTSSSGKVPRSLSTVGGADAHCSMANLDGQCAPMSAAKCMMEEDMKPPLFFIPPQVPPPPLNHHLGGVIVHMNHDVGPPIIHHLAVEGPQVNQHTGMPINHFPGSAGGSIAVNHQVHDGGGGGADAAADSASKSKEGPRDMSPSSPPRKRPTNMRRLKRKRDGHRPSEDGPFRELARAIYKFGDVYERVEIAKLKQATALEKQRRELVKDLEIQRMQFFMQIQIERAKTKYGSNKQNNTENPS